MKKLLCSLAIVCMAFVSNTPPVSAQTPTYAYYDYPAVHFGERHYQIHGYYYYSPWYYILSFENVNAIIHTPEYGDFYRISWTCVSVLTGVQTQHVSPWRLQEQPGSSNYLWAGCTHGYFFARAGCPAACYPYINTEVA